MDKQDLKTIAIVLIGIALYHNGALNVVPVYAGAKK